MDYLDLRDWLEQARALGEVRDVLGASWEEEIGHVTEMLHHTDDAPVGVFDEIPGYPKGYRILVNAMATRRRLALTLGLPLDIGRREIMDQFLALTEAGRAIPSEVVETGPIFENVITGDKVDVLKIPTPWWHPLDGGRYIGTGCAIVMKHPETGWVNVGCYRVMIHDAQNLAIYIAPGKHGAQIRDAWFKRGEPCPVAMVFGMDPLLYLGATLEVPNGVSEYDWVGGIRGEPYPVVNAPITGLPIPANSEIVVEGFLHQGETVPEGPFGEWHGYYATGRHDQPVMKVDAIYHRNDPIMLGVPPNKPPWEPLRYREYLRSALLLRSMKGAGVPGVKDAWCYAFGGNRLFLVVSITPMYAGHARQAMHVAAMCHAGAYMGRYVVVVEDDIDVTDIQEVLWAMVTRGDPERSIDIIKRAWSGPIDPAIHPDEKGHNSRALIDATRPWEWRDKFPPAIGPDPATKLATREKWGWILDRTAQQPDR